MKNRKRLASILAAVLAAIMLLSLIAGILPRPVEAASSSEIKKQLDALKEERKELNNQLSDLKSKYNKDFSHFQGGGIFNSTGISLFYLLSAKKRKKHLY